MEASLFLNFFYGEVLVDRINFVLPAVTDDPHWPLFVRPPPAVGTGKAGDLKKLQL